MSDLLEQIKKNGFKDYSKEGIASYFTFRYPILEHTMFLGYKKTDSSPKPQFKEKNISYEHAEEKTENLLISAIGKIIKGKRKIGVMLSGGLDSSIIAAILRKHFKNVEIYTYSCGFYGEDEFEYSDIVAKLYSDNHKKFILGKVDFIGEKSIIKALIEHKCAPLHPNELPLAIAQKQAKTDGCEVILCGEGADDIFGGYGKNLRMYLNYDKTQGTFAQKIFDEYSYFSTNELNEFIKDEYIGSADFIGNVLKEYECPTDIKNQMFYFIQRLHTKGLIERAENALSYNNLEGGFPFMDDDLVSFVNSLPFEYKVRYKDGFNDDRVKNLNYKEVSEKYDTPKYILKKLSKKYLPEEIIYRPKYGFPVPFEKWFEDVDKVNLDKTVFKTDDISTLSGWKKFMIINLNMFFEIFNKWRNR